jgi:putative RNA 2'-phosphotransferase
MAGRVNPRTLARTLSTLAVHCPWEYGLFWDPDGSMPWKEFYWALQEDPSLRFVRESHIRELAYLGLEIPFSLEGRLLRLKSVQSPVELVPVADPPERLYHAIRRTHLHVVREHGLAPSSRPYLPLASHRELAQRMGKRRDPEPIVIEVYARKAAARGLTIHQAGPGLYLVGPVAVDLLLIPLVREDRAAGGAARHAKKPPEAKPELPRMAGSFLMDVSRFAEGQAQGPPQDKAAGGKRQKGGGWKRASRGERRKRDS